MVDVDELRAVHVLQMLEQADLESLAEQAERLEVSTAGVSLIREGDFGHSVFAIVDGTAEVSVEGAVVRRLGPGDVFGEIAVLSSGRRTASVTSTSAMRLVSFFKRDLWRLADDRPAFGAALREVTASPEEPSRAQT